MEFVRNGRAVSDAALTTAVRDIRRALGGRDDGMQLRTRYGAGSRLVAPDDDRGGSVGTPIDRGARWSAPVLAVSPFQAFDPDPRISYLAAGLALEVTTKLSKFRDVDVRHRNGSLGKWRDDPPAFDTGGTFGVRYLLEGAVRPAVGGVRLAVRLIDAASGRHLWAEQFDLGSEGASEAHDGTTSEIAASSAAVVADLEFRAAVAR